ncbi:hypothetical protein AWC24_04265 [Mycolicibacter senuensis]|uniref:Restriction endonuclease subunit S n=1 Tax=Mycolicibacter senuensis TaxID=386913 RepID=A0A7I9XNG2_9MYCO|nr:hypothetical protein AWC24_04265 [Mycolicibacter senuensis]GFG71469.1 hypothetical protein MSEN_31890 [Mycolicibacter senuensis]
MRNKQLLAESLAVSQDGDEELLSVSHITGITPRSEKKVTMIEAETLGGYRLVEPGDLVINMMWAWMGALGVSRYSGIVSPAYSVYRPRPGVETDTRYFDYLYRSDGYVAEMTRHSRGIHSSRLRIYPNVFLNLQVPQPPLGVQRAIADFLDRETARIDTLIEQQQRLIDLLRERRDAVWSCGLADANKEGMPVQLRRVVASIIDGPFGSALTSAHYSDEGARVIRLGNVGLGEFRDGDAAYITLAYAEELSAHSVAAGDVVIAGLGDDKMPLGRATVVPDIGPAIVKADCYRVRPTDAVSPEYLAWALSAPQSRAEVMLLARGATRARLNTSVVQQVTIPLPPPIVQKALVRKWREQASKIDALIAETERSIELVRERRSALITAAVTGQIDVREAA